MSKDIIQKAYKFRILKPSKTARKRLEQTLYLCRDLYNAALQERRDAYQLNRVSLNYYDQANQLKEIKQSNTEYKELHSQILQDVLKRIDKTFKAFFQRAKQGKAGFPRFKGASRYDSFCFPQSGFSLTGDKLTLSKIGKVKIKLSRQIIGKIKTCTIKREIDKWFVIFTIETAADPLPKTGQAIGVDAGITNFLTLSDGTQIENNRFFQTAQKKLRRAQRAVARKKKGGANRRKAVIKLRKIHQKIKNQRADFQHKTSNWLVQNYDIICIEKLNLAGMVKIRLAKQLHDAAIGNFYIMLYAKAVNAGRKIVEIPAQYTSQTCHACSHCEKANRKTQSDFECVKCNYRNHADVNAALNILRAGISRLALSLPLGEFAKESAAF